MNKSKEMNKSNPLIKGEKNEFINCQCGCGQILLKYDQSYRPRKYINGHNFRFQERNRLGRYLSNNHWQKRLKEIQTISAGQQLEILSTTHH